MMTVLASELKARDIVLSPHSGNWLTVTAVEPKGELIRIVCSNLAFLVQNDREMQLKDGR